MTIPSVLEGFAGDWHGTYRLYLPGTAGPDESASTATLTLAAGGRFLRLDYTWARQGTPQDGSLLVGRDPKSGEVFVHWIDAWHMSDQVMACRGPVTPEGGLSVAGSYAAPPGPDWGWRTAVARTADDGLRLTMFNITPDGEEMLAVEAVYQRAADRPEGAQAASAPRSTEFHGTISVPGPVDAAFELFSPDGERRWVPGWNPQLLHPPGATWEEGLVFRTREERGDALWLVTRLDRDGHAVEYHRMEPGRYVACVRVACTAEAPQQTRVQVAYRFVGLSEDGSREIAAMTAEAYEEKMARWTRWIAAHLRSGASG